MSKPFWNVTDEPSAGNVAAILADLDRSDVPGPAIDALRGYLAVLESTVARLTDENERLKARRKLPRRGEKLLTVQVQRGDYDKAQPIIRVSWVCQECGKRNEREQLPGNPPRYCLPSPGERVSACQRKAHNRAAALYRAKQRSEQPDESDGAID